MKKIVIVESPTKAKTLNKILPKDFSIEASMGHIRDLPKKGLGVLIEDNFTPEYEIPQKAKKIVTKLKKLSKEAKEIILATDPDREGEAIAWHLKHILSSTKDGKKLKFSRVAFHELTKEAVLEAFKHSGDINQALVNAQQARRILDRLVGYKLSPLLWKKVRYGLSAGRVQSVAVRLVVERERERSAFSPEEYWTIEVSFNDSKKRYNLLTTIYEKDSKTLKLSNKTEVDNVLSDLAKDAFSVNAVKKSQRVKHAYPPLKTSTLQQTMANVYGLSAKKTMSAAQKLFEEGLITYHRTDSLSLSPEFIANTRNFISNKLGKKYLPEKPNIYKTKEKNAQEAHEAIRPTDLSCIPSDKKINKLGSDCYKTYLMIFKRALESQCLPAIYDQTSIKVLSKKGYGFRATGSIINFDGWLGISSFLGLDKESDDINVLPDVIEGEPLHLNKTNSLQHFTQPPARYTDASLIKKLEELGIGRPSTYAPTLSTIQSRGYVEKDGRSFVPTAVAYVVTDLFIENIPSVIEYDFTATMEEKFDDIATGKIDWVSTIRDFYIPFEKIVAEKDKTLNKRDITTLEETKEKCPDCGERLLVKLGKYGKFLSCSNYPTCEFARPLSEDIPKDENGHNISDFGKCESCEDGVYILKQGRFGKFLACSNYPKCKTTKPYLEKIGMVCPKCNTGDIIVKKAKGRTFYGCSNYPECNYSSWKNPKLTKTDEGIETNQEEESVNTIA